MKSNTPWPTMAAAISQRFILNLDGLPVCPYARTESIIIADSDGLEHYRVQLATGFAKAHFAPSRVTRGGGAFSCLLERHGIVRSRHTRTFGLYTRILLLPFTHADNNPGVAFQISSQCQHA